MRWSTEQARERFLADRVARLATVSSEGRPHMVPVTFAGHGDRLFTAVDHKPKRTTALRRLANIEANPQVCLLADHYSDDWRALWWARADGRARVVHEGEERRTALDLLKERYPQYVENPPEGPVIAIDIDHWSGWSFT